MLNKIIECENRLMQDRKLLNHLLEEYQAGNKSEIIRLKMEELQHEVNSMNQQIAVFRNEYNSHMQMERQAQNSNASMPYKQAQNPNPAMQYQQAPPPNPAMQYRYQQVPQQMPPVNTANAYSYTVQPHGQKKQDVEKTIGKSLMGICASVLIFVSIILFATLVVPYMTDFMKQVLMFGVSFAFAIVGNILLTRDKQNKWFLSIAGCGMGAVYISLLVSLFYFESMTDIGLYICILVWAVVAGILSRLRSQVFLGIGQIGVLISVAFGVGYCNGMEDGVKILFLVVYFLLAETVFYIVNMQKEYGKNILNHIFMALCLCIFLFTDFNEFFYGELAGCVASVVLTVLAFVPIAMGVFYSQIGTRDTVAFGVLNTIFFFIAYLSSAEYLGDMPIVWVPVAIVFLAGMEWRFADGMAERNSLNVGKRIFQVALLVFIFWSCMNTDFVWNYSSVVLPAIACLLYGFIKDKKVYKIAGIVFCVWFVLIPIDDILYFVWGSVIFALLVSLMIRFKEQYRTWLKLTAYPIFLLFVIINVCRLLDAFSRDFGELQHLSLLTLLAVINICMMKVPVLRRNLQTGAEEEGVFIEAGIIHLFQMMVALIYIKLMEPFGYHLFAIMLGLVLFLVNVQKLLRKYDSRWSSIYVGTKLFVFFLVILNSFKAPDYLFSITALLFAIAFIAAGFVAETRTGKKVKTIRIYGLVLSLLSIVKLLLLDIHYDNMLSLAVSFFISGLLCFAISFIYNRVDKKMAQKSE